MTHADARAPRTLRDRLRGRGRLRLKPGRLTLRTRLTLVYGSLFLAAGVVLLGVTYVLFSQQLGNGGPLSVSSGGIEEAPSPAPRGDAQPPPGLSAFEESERERLNDAAVTSLLTLGGIALAVVATAAGGLGWLIAGRVLAPLHQVTDTARRIAAAPTADRSLHERIALAGPRDEVKDLADAFDTMVERLDRSFDGQRLFVANASHELRTPLTLGRALAEMAIHRKTASEDVKELGEELLQINDRHERLISGLLLLAGAENHIPEPAPVDLAEVVTHVVTQSTAEAERAGVTLYAQPGTAWTAGDPLLLERIVQNLADNGIRHNTATSDGWVRITSRTREEHVEIEVSNTGPEIPPYDIPALFQPFRRLRTERLVTAEGSGLGLSIVRAVTHAHRGEVTAHPNPAGGLTVVVTLPRRAGSS
ncbi:sensor histidine kinase [Streptomyces mayteni]